MFIFRVPKKQAKQNNNMYEVSIIVLTIYIASCVMFVLMLD